MDTKIIRQKPIVIFEYNESIAIGATYSGNGIPVVGLTRIVGMIYTDKLVNLIVSQGCNNKGGILRYRNVRSYSIQPLTCEPREFKIFGKFVKIEIENISGSVAEIDSFFQALGI